MFISSDKVVSVFSVVQWFLDLIAKYHAKKMQKQMQKQDLILQNLVKTEEAAAEALKRAQESANKSTAEAKTLEDAHLEEGAKAAQLCMKLKNL